MDLSDRKQRILQAIIDEYVGTAEPVGSRAISKRNELGLSSATIRNEMADLEDMGYLVKPHTSAGRIPSDSGYRFYVDSLMRRYQMSVEAAEQLKSALADRVNQLDVLIKRASMITSTLTEYTTVVTTPALNRSVIQKLDLICLGNGMLMLIIVTRSGLIKNRVLAVDIAEADASKLQEIFNKCLAGKVADEITLDMIKKIEDFAEGELQLPTKNIIAILNFLYEAIDQLDETEVYVNNAKSILQYPEFADVKKAREMLDFLENKENIIKLIGSGRSSKSDGVGIKIGAENECKELENSSLITVDYSVGDRVLGKIGVIGPKRMNYAKVIASLDCISNHIDNILKQLYTEGEG